MRIAGIELHRITNRAAAAIDESQLQGGDLGGDRIAIAAPADRDDGRVIAAARDQVTALVSAEDDILAALRGRMRG